MRHKLTTFILKNPPKKSKKSRGNTADSAAGQPAIIPGEAGVEDPADGGADSDDELTKRIAAQAATLGEVSGDVTFETDTSAAAVAERMKALSGKMSSMVIGDDEDEEGDDANSPYTVLGTWIEVNRDETNAVEVYRKIQELGIEKKHRTVQVVIQALFTAKILAEFPNYAPVLKKLVQGEKHQKALLGGTERLVGIEYPELVASVPKILMAYYQADLIEEEIVKQWGTHVSKKYVDRDTSKKVRKASEPFLKVSVSASTLKHELTSFLVARGSG